MEGKYFVVLVLVVLDLVFEVKADNNASDNNINTCLFDNWRQLPVPVLSGNVACLGSQLCYSVNGAKPALFAVCYNTTTRIPDFTGHIVVANVASGGGRQDWHNEGGPYVEPLLTAISPQRPPLHNDHLYTTTTSTQRPPLHNDHLYTTATSTQRPPLHNDHLYTTTTSTQRPPLHNDHLYTTTTSTQRPPLHNDHLHTTTTSTQRPPPHNDHLYTTTTSTQRPPLHNDHLYTTTTSTQRPSLHNDHLYTTTTSTQRPPLHNERFELYQNENKNKYCIQCT
ncbi:hypothetical protein QZH41_006819 [Actinostola sp. cb2023]|nr:hypothetical protein QZH41_006819 [Actinostola sp. cb2023]